MEPILHRLHREPLTRDCPIHTDFIAYYRCWFITGSQGKQPDAPIFHCCWPCPSRRLFHGTSEPIYSGSPLKREIDWLHPSDFSQLPANLSHVPVQDLLSCITSLWQALMRQISVTDFVYCKWTPPMFVSIVQPCVTPKQSNEHPCVSLLCSHVS